MVNLHFSLLPRWRGAAPVERAILAGDQRTGVCLMALEETLDTGGIYRCAEVDIGPGETLEELRGRLVALGSNLLLDALGGGLGTPRPQDGEVTYAAKVDPTELELDWSRPAAELGRVVRIGRAWTTFRGRRLLVWKATVGQAPDAGGEGAVPGRLVGDAVATGAGWLRLEEVQPEGRARQPMATWRRGARPGPDERLGP
jgi:methionyl-tRNA formyltransferase